MVTECAASPSLDLLWSASLTDSPDQNPGTNEFGTREVFGRKHGGGKGLDLGPVFAKISTNSNM